MNSLDVAVPEPTFPRRMSQYGTNPAGGFDRYEASVHASSVGGQVVQIRVDNNKIPLFIQTSRKKATMEASSNAHLAIIFVMLLVVVSASTVSHFLISSPIPMLVAGLGFLGIAAIALYARRLSGTAQDAR